MIQITVTSVSSEWPDVANPDDLTVEINLERTTHEFYPSLRELVVLYNDLTHERDTERSIGTADVISLGYPRDGFVRIELPPLQFVERREQLLRELETVIGEVFAEKDNRGSGEDRDEGLAAIQRWLDDLGGSVHVRDLYESLTA